MNRITPLLIAVLVLYALFVAVNTYIYHEKQGEDAPATLQIQWGF